MAKFNLFMNLKFQRAKKQSMSKYSSDHNTISTLDTSTLSGHSIQSFEPEKTLDIHELEHILQSTNRSRYSKQDVHLSVEQELDLELARITGLLERSEKRRLTSQEYIPVV